MHNFLKMKNDNNKNRRNDKRRPKPKANGERLLKDPELVHNESENDEEREYLDTMTAEELEEVTKAMKRKINQLDRQDLKATFHKAKIGNNIWIWTSELAFLTKPMTLLPTSSIHAV